MFAPLHGNLVPFGKCCKRLSNTVLQQVEGIILSKFRWRSSGLGALLMGHCSALMPEGSQYYISVNLSEGCAVHILG
jgi:hypothetical protein